MQLLMENVNFHDGEVVSIKLDYVQKLAILFVVLEGSKKSKWNVKKYMRL